MASQLQNENLLPYNRAYLCQELQWAGRDEACAALGEVLLDEDLTDAAAMALAAIGGECAAAPLRAAATKAKGRGRLNIVDALAALSDPKAAEVFKSALGDPDTETRIAAGAGWARLGQPDAAKPLLAAADGAKGWERMQQTKSCLVLAEKLAAAGKASDANKIYQHLLKTRTDPAEAYVREAAQLGLDEVG
jgi:HEAT repeat protein